MLGATQKCGLSFLLLMAAMVLIGAGPADAEDLRLRLKGGGFEVTGKLKSYQGNRYIIDSPAFGVMSIDADRFDCLEGACPSGGRVAALDATPAVAPRPVQSDRDIIVAGSNTIGNALMPALIEKYAARQGYEATRVVGTDPLDLDFQLKDSNGNRAGSIRLERHGSSTSFRELDSGRV